jgi:hypothetical protein
MIGRSGDAPANSITIQGELYSTPEVLTDAEKLALAAERYVAPNANSALTGNLTLPTTTTPSGTTITANIAWTSSNTDVISNLGVVTRPAIGSPDADVTMSYVLSVGELSTESRDIAYTVKALEDLPVVYANDLFINFYMEGSTGNRKVIAVHNNTGGTVDLSNYKIGSINNLTAAPVAANISGPTLSGNLEQGKSIIIHHTDLTNVAATGYIAEFKTMIDTLPTGNIAVINGYTFNGTQGDVMAVAKNISGTWTFVDFLGEWTAAISSGTSASWETSYTKDKSLYRKSTVVNPTSTTDWNEWEVADVHSFDSRTYTWR